MAPGWKELPKDEDGVRGADDGSEWGCVGHSVAHVPGVKWGRDEG